MESLKIEPRYGRDTVGALRRLQDALRARTFELVRRRCWETGSVDVDGALIKHCALEAMRKMVAEGEIA